MMMKLRFKILVLSLIFTYCKFPITLENEKINIDEVVVAEVLEIVTTTTIPKEKEETVNISKKEYLSELSIGTCFDAENFDSFTYNQTVIVKSCFTPHTYEVVFKKTNEFSTNTGAYFISHNAISELESAAKCNEFKSLVEITEYVDDKYQEYWLTIEPVVSNEEEISFNSTSFVMCIAYLEDFHFEVIDSVNFSIRDDIDFWIYNTYWEDEQFFGIECYPDTPSFWSTFDFFFAEQNAKVQEMTFTYINEKLDLVIEVDLYEKMKYFSVEHEEMFYYSLKTSSLYIETLFQSNPLSEEMLDKVFSSNEGVIGKFSYTNQYGDKYEAICSMEE